MMKKLTDQEMQSVRMNHLLLPEMLRTQGGRRVVGGGMEYPGGSCDDGNDATLDGWQRYDDGTWGCIHLHFQRP